jgi:hypothetical protein
MKLPFKFLFAVALFHCSMAALDWSWSLHADPWRASDFANEQVAAKGIDWPQDSFYELGGGRYRARYVAPDSRCVTIEVSKRRGVWRVDSLKQGKALWQNVADSR